MNKKSLILALAVAVTAPAFAETDQQARQHKNQSFEEFRKGILSDYQEFRQTLLDRYADFLNGEWHAYESYKGQKRDSKPKPRVVPKADTAPSPVEDRARPAVSRPAVNVIKEPDKKPVPQPEDAECNLPVPKKDKQPADAVKPDKDKQPDAAVKHKKNNVDADRFSFYGLTMQLPRIDFNITQKLYSNNDYASQWRNLQDANVASRVLPEVKAIADEAGLNDYLTFQLIKFYIDSKFPAADKTSKMAAVHYLLANMGYDARIAVTGEGIPLLLIPFKQTIYARTYMMIGNKKYYVFEPDGYSLAEMGPQSIMTCRLPDDADKGRSMDLRLGELRLPEKLKSFEYEYGPIHLKGEINENIMPVLYHYPQMPVSDFANSNVQPALRNSLVEQVRSQVAGMEGDEAVATLLAFMHKVFTYSTDEDFHGFEKPYFLEETLYYPKNDCEDRAIFYTYFLWNALGRESQLISFPGHEAATVRLDKPVEGTCYDYDGATYYISDPTYIGSSTGMIMPPYRNESPNIDYTFR